MTASIRYAALLDTETTGLSPIDGAKTIEVAVCLYDLKYASPVDSFSALIRAISNEAEHINGIKPELLVAAREPDEVWRAVKWLIGPASVVVAHSANFDRQFCPDFGKPWACSKTDIRWPGRLRGDHLVQLALALGLGVASAHRAMADVDTLSRIFTRIAEQGHDLEAILIDAMRPKALFVSMASFDLKDLVKSHGFSWDYLPGDTVRAKKVWYRSMPPEDVAALPFRVRQVVP